jgi:hypothetical protein
VAHLPRLRGRLRVRRQGQKVNPYPHRGRVLSAAPHRVPRLPRRRGNAGRSGLVPGPPAPGLGSRSRRSRSFRPRAGVGSPRPFSSPSLPGRAVPRPPTCCSQRPLLLRASAPHNGKCKRHHHDHGHGPDCPARLHSDPRSRLSDFFTSKCANTMRAPPSSGAKQASDWEDRPFYGGQPLSVGLGSHLFPRVNESFEYRLHDVP